MTTSPAPGQPIVVLIGNYPLDRQESMLRFRDLIQSRLDAAGWETVSIFPGSVIGGVMNKGPLVKWLRYVDKYIFFPFVLKRKLAAIKRKVAGRKVVVHICDHSNAVYTGAAQRFSPVLVSCHDLLAVRGALGEDTDCPASAAGKILQKAILRGVAQANAVACISQATRGDLIRLAGAEAGEKSVHVPLALNYPYHPMSRDEALAELARAGLDLPYRGYVLHVGSSLRRKNREALLRAVALIREEWPGEIVFAGEALLPEERELARSLGLEKRVREVSRPDNETLRALYAAAHALIFMSRFEGFGWPVLEAQASGCPVICSNRTSVPEVAGEAGLVHEPDDYAGIARDIQRLQDAAFRDNVTSRGLENAASYSSERMMGSYEEIYRRLAEASA